MAASGGKLAAMICAVWSDTCVNLVVFDGNGSLFSRSSVLLIQEDNAIPLGGMYCEWMQYQTGQAEKTAQLERELAKKAFQPKGAFVEEVFAAIESEREYQEQKWPGHHHSVGEWLLIIEKLCADAWRAWVTGHGDNSALHEVRQIHRNGGRLHGAVRRTSPRGADNLSLTLPVDLGI